MEHVPCDTHMRERLDPVIPESLRPSFTSVFRQLQRGKALEEMVFLEGHYLVALDGTGYFSSPTIHCASCLQKVHRNGSITYYHQMLGAAIIHPDVREVIPLMPEPIKFISIKPSVATESGGPGSCAGHSRVPSPDHGHPASTGGSGPSRYGSA